MPGSIDNRHMLEQRTIAAHRRYLAALMEVERSETETGTDGAVHSAVEAAHEVRFRVLCDLIAALGYVPRGLARRSDLIAGSDPSMRAKPEGYAPHAGA
ncbi:hypothetical protein [Methylobacterium indicum]|uniref:Uncharacterized protein n=1 Tax=Methylobacterium indicum TaxID=1775910 RepID=A0A8H9CAP6_9HYPH|nr:hypothetical protein [Methylobacterium indicum]BCM87665.1 hypothetical protein mvi_61260 [Methylobacterium indicum]